MSDETIYDIHDKVDAYNQSNEKWAGILFDVKRDGYEEAATIDTPIGQITATFETIDKNLGESGYVLRKDGQPEPMMHTFLEQLIEFDMAAIGWTK